MARATICSLAGYFVEQVARGEGGGGEEEASEEGRFRGDTATAGAEQSVPMAGTGGTLLGR